MKAVMAGGRSHRRREGSVLALWVGIMGEGLASLGRRPTRTALTMMGTIIGIGCFVAVLGLSATAAGQISQDFSEQIATQVEVHDAGVDQGAQWVYSFPADAEARVQRLNGVVASGVSWVVGDAVDVATAVAAVEAPIVAATSGYIAAMDPEWDSGGAYGQFQQDERLPVVVLGAVVASQLGIERANTTVLVNGSPFLVAGIVGDVSSHPEILTSLLMPTTTVWDRFGPPTSISPAMMVIRTNLGAAQQVAAEVARQLRPDDPSLVAVVPPPDPPRMASVISGAMEALFTALAGVTLLIGGAVIANTTLVSVLERSQEIGLRRAVGAGSLHVMMQILGETVVLGGVAGLIGASVGLLVVIVVSLGYQWTAVMPSWVVAISPAMGAGVGLLAGLYPAWRAGRMSPIQALRR